MLRPLTWSSVVVVSVALSACIRTSGAPGAPGASGGSASQPATEAAAAAAGTATTADAAGVLPPDVTPAMLALGDSLFNNGSCQRCHGAAGVGGTRGPRLVDGEWLHGDGSFAAIVRTITVGVPRTALRDTTRTPMRARGGPMNLDDAQVRAVAGYVVTISRGRR